MSVGGVNFFIKILTKRNQIYIISVKIDDEAGSIEWLSIMARFKKEVQPGNQLEIDLSECIAKTGSDSKSPGINVETHCSQAYLGLVHRFRWAEAFELAHGAMGYLTPVNSSVDQSRLTNFKTASGEKSSVFTKHLFTGD